MNALTVCMPPNPLKCDHAAWHAAHLCRAVDDCFFGRKISVPSLLNKSMDCCSVIFADGIFSH